jgi:putative ABC transport system ATP-binding protein
VIPTSCAAVAACGVAKAFRAGAARVEALRGVDFEAAPGEFVALMGASGSGKSTLLHILAGLTRPTMGSVLVGGVDLTKLDDDARTLLRRRRIGLVFQDFNLIDVLTAEENVALPLAMDGRAPAEATRRARRALEAVGLAGRRTHRPGQMSGGEQQRTALARAMAVEPVVLLADEPTGNLDSANARQVLGLMRGLADEHGLAVVMVTHDAAQARLAVRLVTLRDGAVVSSSAAAGPEAA